MRSPKELKVTDPVKLLFASGFLGAGKTTALAALAKELLRRGMRVGIITNDQSGNLADTLIARQMLTELGVPVEEVVEGCYCCRFDELIDQMEKILAHRPQVLMGEPVGSCTDFVAAVANPIKIHYKDAFKFTPFSCLVDPQRVQELLLSKAQSGFPEEVAYLFQKQLEEADIIVLNKTDFLSKADKQRLVAALQDRFQDKMVMAVSAKKGDGMKAWLDFLLAGRPGAGSVLRQIDYNRYAAAEAVLGWLNSAVKLTAEPSFEASAYLTSMVYQLQDMFKRQHAAVGHLKFVMTNAGKSMWANLTSLHTEPSVSDKPLGHLAKASLIINARIRMEPAVLESVVRQALDQVSAELGVHAAIIDLQCFRPAYPDPPYVIREDPQASY